MKILSCGRDLYIDNSIRILWLLTKKCGMNGNACPDCKTPDNSEPYLEWNDTKKILDFISYIKHHKRSVSVSLQGCGSLTHPDILRIISEIECSKLFVRTNLIGYDDEIIQEINNIRKCCFNIFFTPYQTNVAEFKERLKSLLEKNRIVKLTLNFKEYGIYEYGILSDMIDMSNTYESLTLRLSNRFAKDEEISKIILKLQKNLLTQETIRLTYEESIDKSVKDTFVSREFFNLNRYKSDFKGFLCDAGMKSLFIDSNADLYRCKTYCVRRIGKVFNIARKNFRNYTDILYKRTICKSDLCIYNIYVKKDRIKGNENIPLDGSFYSNS